MWDDEKKSVLTDFRSRKIISSIAPPDVPEIFDPEEIAWRDTHVQRFFCRNVVLMLDGSTSLSLNGKVYRAAPNTMMLVNYGELHDSGIPSYSPDHHHLSLMIRPSSICCGGYEFIDGVKTTKFNYVFKDIGVIKQINYYWDNTFSGNIDPQTGLFCILNHINRVFEVILRDSDQLIQHIRGWTPQVQAIEKVRKYIDSNCGKNCNIDFLARMCGFSQMHFQRLFRKHMNMTLKQYINMLRSRRYDEMRLEHPLKEIADELGFSSASALCNWLKTGYLGFNNK